ncbi:immunoglobulin domain-containing protein [Candidatus Babela massiliensis]|uniref:Immunoglobulin-like repeats containing protein domain n=1 Tax=Candidatus Babela massiliensis TaxID=673862 RepID=V6DIF6_9BACT|nr:immunoglobulin domain-containing protein [Candidatus Babela massiliensis]CDK30311.1 Immunoglobulin-like repeats containing protein domain [Candidatus Babela massiliensis]
MVKSNFVLKIFLFITLFIMQAVEVLNGACSFGSIVGSLSNATGTLALGATYGFDYSPVTSSGMFAAITDYSNSRVYLYQVNQSTGAFTQINNYVTGLGARPISVSFSEVTQSGNLFAGVCNSNANSVSLYQVTSSGLSSLTSISGLAIQPYSIAFSSSFSSGTSEYFFACVVGYNSDGTSAIYLYQVDANTGTFTQITSGIPSISSGSNPRWVDFSQVTSGNNLFLAIAYSGTNVVSVYNVDTTSGGLTETSNLSVSSPYGVAFSPITSSGQLFLASANYGDSTLSLYQVNQDSGIANLWQSVSGGTSPTSVAFSPLMGDTLLLAAVNQGTSNEPSILTYQVNFSIESLTLRANEALVRSSLGGALSGAVSFSPISTQGMLFVGASDNFQYVSTYVVTQCLNGTCARGSLYNSTGEIAGGSTYGFDYSPVTSFGMVAAVTDYPGARVHLYQVDPYTGGFSEINSSGTGISPVAVSFSHITQSGNLFAGVCNYASNSVSLYQVTSSGLSSLASISGLSFSPNSISFSPSFSTGSDEYFFASVVGRAGVYLCRVNANTGSFTPITSGLPTIGTSQWTDFSPITSSGDLFLAIADTQNNTIFVYNVDTTNGSLTEVSSETVSSPYGVVFSPITPSGQLFLASANYSDNSISIYQVNQTTGALTLAANTSGGTGPRALSFSPITLEGSLFLSVVNEGGSSSGSVLIYNVDTSGSLGYLGTSSLVTNSSGFANGWAIAFSPISSQGQLFLGASGQYAYASTYQVNQCLISPTPASVCNNGSITFTGNILSGTESNYTYSWTGPNSYTANTQTITISPATVQNRGIYTLVVTDTDGNIVGNEAVFLSVGSLSVSVIPTNSLVCVGSNVTLTATASGSSGYTYSWTGPNGYTSTGNSITISNIASNMTGLYTVTVTDASSCQASSSSRVIVDVINFSIRSDTGSTNICQGSSITLDANITSGIAPYTYSWTGPNNFVSSSDTITVSDAGTYTLTITDALGCTSDLVSQVITSSNSPSVTILASPSNSTCLGTGITLTAQAAGGSGVYDNYEWSYNGVVQPGNSSTYVIDGSSIDQSGNYSVTVTDSNGCSGASPNLVVTVSNNPVVTISPSPATVCQGSNITLIGNVSNGSGSYTYQWTLNGTIVGTSSTLIVNNASLSDTGSYLLTVSDSVTGCSGSNTVSLTVNSNPTVTVSPATVSSCIGRNVTLTANIICGNDSYTYNWTGPNGFTATGSTITVPNLTSAGAGTYTVTITDSSGIQAQASSNVIVNPNPTLVITPNPAITCVGTDITFTGTAKGGSGTYTYSWVFNGTEIGTSSTLTIVNPDSSSAGNYTLIVTDSNGCQASSSIILTVNENIQVEAIACPSLVCSNSNVTLTAYPSCGSGDYSYSWSGPNGYTSFQNPLTLLNVTADYSGLYNVTVTDSQGNQAYAFANLLVNDNPLVTITPNPAITCVGTDITLLGSATGGSGDYSYQWLFNGNVIGTTSSLTIADPSLSDSGAYSLTVTDTEGCQTTASVNLIVSDTLVVAINPSSTAICSGGSVTLTAAAGCGSGGYIYQWTLPNGSTYTGNPLVVSSATSSDSGTYSVIVTDSDGNQASSNAQLTVNNNPSVVINPNPATVCTGSSITLNAISSGGSGFYTYQWLFNGSVIGTNSTLTINNASASAEGQYTVIVADSNGCIANSSVTLTVNDSPQVNITPNPAIVCVGENITLMANITGGSSEYISYQWIFNGNIVSTSTTLSISNANLTDSGIYQFTVTDSNNCSSTSSVNLIVSDMLTVVIDPDAVILCTGNTLTLTAIANCGSGDYSYQWTLPNGETFTGNPLVVNSVSSSNIGTYRVVVTDSNGNQASYTSQVSVNEVDVNIISGSDLLNATQTICQGQTITLTAQVISGNPPYTYQWTGPNGFSSTEQIINIPNAQIINSGTYSVVVTSCDETGQVCCIGQSSAQVIVNNIEVSITPSSIAVCPASNITLSSNVIGGISPYTYQWSGPNGFTATTQDITINNISASQAGTYTLTVTDSNGCSSTSSSVIDIEPLLISVIPNTPVVEEGGSITLRADIVCGQGPFIYQWTGPNGFTSNSPIITINNANVLNTGTYTLTVTDVNGNIITITIEVILDNLSVNIISNTLNIRQGQTIVLIAEPKDGQPPYTYQWFGPAVTRSTSGQLISTDQILIVNDATTANSGIYTVVVTDAYGFTASDSVNVTVRTTSSLSNAISAKYCS